MENPPFEDVFPIKMGIFHCYVSLPEGTYEFFFDTIQKVVVFSLGFRIKPSKVFLLRLRVWRLDYYCQCRFPKVDSITYLGCGFKYFLFSPYLGKIPILTNIFQMGWNHQPAIVLRKLPFGNGSSCRFPFGKLPPQFVDLIGSKVLQVFQFFQQNPFIPKRLGIGRHNPWN